MRIISQFEFLEVRLGHEIKEADPAVNVNITIAQLVTLFVNCVLNRADYE